MQKRKYIYLSNIDYSGTIYTTQVIDWLEAYNMNNVTFDLWQALHFINHVNVFRSAKMISMIKKNTQLYKGCIYLFPSSGIGYIINSILLGIKLLKFIFNYSEILIFSR